MSIHYGLHCKTDDAYSGCGINHGDDILRDVVKMAPHIAAIYELDTRNYIEINLLGGWYTESSDEELGLFDWIVKHHDHDLEIYNEYGKTEAL